MKVIVTGGAGFIGANFLHWLNNFQKLEQIIVIDSLTYAGHLESIGRLIDQGRVHFLQADINDESIWHRHLKNCECIFNFAAESHVDNSIASSRPFMDSNFMGVHTILDSIRKKSPKTRLVQISTDEVYGSIEANGQFDEGSPLNPSSPYSASKAAADLLVMSYVKTYDLNALITRSSNNYGPYQFPEKFIPVMITKAQADQTLPIYGEGKNIRDWIFVDDNCAGIWWASQKGKTGNIYNLGGGNEIENLTLAKTILDLLNKPDDLIKFVGDRLGHDFRYSVDCSKAKCDLTWVPVTDFATGLKNTLNWYNANEEWVSKVLSKKRKLL